jgi:predicted transcriptional regulator
MMGENEVSSDGQWSLVWRITKDFNSYFESDTCYQINVYHNPTKTEVMTLWRDEFANASGSENSGVRSAKFASDSASVIVEYEDGRTASLPLIVP